MNKATQIIITVCALIVLAIAVCGLVSCGVNGVNYKSVEHKITENFEDLSINVNTTDVSIAQSEDDTVKVVCRERKNDKHTVTVSDGTLEIEALDKKWYQQIDLFSFGSPAVTVYLPKTEYGKLLIESDTGDVDIPKGYSFADANISVDTGKINVEGITCGALSVKNDTGNVSLKDVVCDSLVAEADTGDIDLCGIRCVGALDIEVDTGDVSISDASFDSIGVRSSTGKVDLSKTEADGAINIETTTGNVEINGCTAADASVRVDTGDVTAVGARLASLTVRSDTGDVDLDDVIAAGKFDIETSTGRVKFAASDAAEVFISTSTGGVVGSFLTDKVIFAESGTGKVDVPKLTEGGRCEISTGTGRIDITIGQ